MAASLTRIASGGQLCRTPSSGQLSRAPLAPPAAARASPRGARAPAPGPAPAALPGDGDIAVPNGAATSPRGGKIAAHGTATVVAPVSPMPPGALADLLAGPFHPELRLGAAAAAAAPPAPPSPHQPLPPAALTRPPPPPAVEPGAFADAFEMGDLLGRGSFGEVRSAVERDTGRRVAIKVLAKSQGGRDKRETILQEVAFCQALEGSPIAARVYGVYEDADSIYIAQELCSGGDVAGLQAVAEGGRLSEREAASIMLSVLRFLAHAHSRGVCYGDVKPNNFVLRSLYPSVAHMIDPTAPKGRLDLCAVDFGCCQCAEPDVCLAGMPVSGTPAYLSPEAFNECFGVPADVWAAGVMLYHLLSGGFPFWVGRADQFHGMTQSELRDGIVRGSPMFTRDPWAGYSPRVKDLICKMLEKDPGQRISAAAACSHIWFAEVLGDDSSL